ncbi:MAG: hypothetical protein ACYTFY_16950 [Planctomycetota bacterium]
MLNKFKILILTLLLILSFNSLYALDSENTAVVINSESEDSVKIAETFIKLRNIPEENIIKITGIKDVEQCTVGDFRKTILMPVMETIKKRRLSSKISLIAYSAGIPWFIDLREDVGKGNLWSPYKKPFASITGLTFLYEMVLKKDFYSYTDRDSNLYARMPAAEKLDTEWTAEEIAAKRKVDNFFKQRIILSKKRLNEFRAKLKKEGKKFNWKMEIPMREKDQEWEDKEWPEVKKLLTESRNKHPYNRDLLIKYAQSLTIQGKPSEAIEAINDAVKGGLLEYISISSNSDFKSINKSDEFKAVISKMKNRKFEIPEPLEFNSNLYFKPDGTSAEEGPGRKYLLSMVLGVTSGRGNTADEVINMLERSKKAEGSNPDGTIYIAKNGGVRSTTREWAFKKTVEQLKRQGIKAEIVDGILPEKKNDVAGAVIGSSAYDWEKSGSTILPGAICEHLTSFGGRLFKKAGQVPISQHIRHGASATSGTVIEPHAIQAKFPMPYLHCYYTQGYTAVESFYMVIRQPFQILLIGDPLCRPWKK